MRSVGLQTAVRVELGEEAFQPGGVESADDRIVLLLVAIGVTIAQFWTLSRAAALLLVPYAAWVSFATCLKAAIWWLNR